MDSLVQGAIYKENLVQQGHHFGTSCQIQWVHVEAILCWKSYLSNNINNCCNKRKCFCWNQSHCWLWCLSCFDLSFGILEPSWLASYNQDKLRESMTLGQLFWHSKVTLRRSYLIPMQLVKIKKRLSCLLSHVNTSCIKTIQQGWKLTFV